MRECDVNAMQTEWRVYHRGNEQLVSRLRMESLGDMPLSGATVSLLLKCKMSIKSNKSMPQLPSPEEAAQSIRGESFLSKPAKPDLDRPP